MEQYISKFALAAEIERRIKTYKEEIGKYSPFKVYDIIGKKEECNDLLSFIDTLEVKEVDLEKEIDSIEDRYHGFESLSIADIMEIIKYFFELGLKARKGE